MPLGKKMSKDNNYNRFSDLTFDDFKVLASDSSLSKYERIGFPDEYRKGKEESIFRDIRSKLSALDQTNKTVMDIGPGCSDLPLLLAALSKRNAHELIFIDSGEMLAHLPDITNIQKLAGSFPSALEGYETQLTGRVDAIIAYSVIQYVFAEGGLFCFVDKCLSLLAAGGEVLLGDVPNITMRKRFFKSEAGIASHYLYTGAKEDPEVNFNQLELGHIDDSIVMAVLSRARAQGFHAWVVPQDPSLPMANRREDILIRKP